jgi:superfamily II DNA helicase RecQ
VCQLKKAGISAVHAYHKRQCKDVSSGKYRFGSFHIKFVFICNCSHIDINLVFMSPETLQVREWRSVLSDEMFRKQIVVVAVDEAHCISEWLVWS